MSLAHVETERGAEPRPRARSAPQRPQHGRSAIPPSIGRHGDLLAAVLVLGAAAAAALTDAQGAALGPRAALAALVVFFIPGYLVLEALFPEHDARRPSTFLRAIMALGLSPPIVGLIALSSAAVRGGFQASTIVSLVTLVSLALAGIVLLRRHRHGSAAGARSSKASARPGS